MDEGKIEKPMQFIERPPVEWWSGVVTTSFPEDIFERNLTKGAKELHFRFSGYRTEPDKKGAFQYVFSSYVRRNFGPLPTKQQYQDALRVLSDSVAGDAREERRAESPRFRVLFGLVEGYDAAQAVVHSPEEVVSALSALGSAFKVQRVEILAVGGGRDLYTEPAVVIEGDLSEINKVYQLADQFRQERIVVQDMQAGKSYAVETRWCKQPDETPV